MSNSPNPVDTGGEAFKRNLTLIARAFGGSGASDADMKQIFAPFFGLAVRTDLTDEQIYKKTMKSWSEFEKDETPEKIRFQIADQIKNGMPIYDVEAWIDANIPDSKAAKSLTGWANRLHSEQNAFYQAIEERNRNSVYHKLGIPEDIASNPMRDWTDEDLVSMFPDQYAKLGQYSQKNPDLVSDKTGPLDTPETAAALAKKTKLEEDMQIRVAKRNLEAAEKVAQEAKAGIIYGGRGGVPDQQKLDVLREANSKVSALRELYQSISAPRQALEDAERAKKNELDLRISSGSRESRAAALKEYQLGLQNKLRAKLADEASTNIVGPKSNYMAPAYGGTGYAIKTDNRAKGLRKQVDEKVRGGLREAGLTPLLLWLAKSAQVSAQLKGP